MASVHVCQHNRGGLLEHAHGGPDVLLLVLSNVSPHAPRTTAVAPSDDFPQRPLPQRRTHRCRRGTRRPHVPPDLVLPALYLDLRAHDHRRHRAGRDGRQHGQPALLAHAHLLRRARHARGPARLLDLHVPRLALHVHRVGHAEHRPGQRRRALLRHRAADGAARGERDLSGVHAAVHRVRGRVPCQSGGVGRLPVLPDGRYEYVLGNGEQLVREPLAGSGHHSGVHSVQCFCRAGHLLVGAHAEEAEGGEGVGGDLGETDDDRSRASASLAFCSGRDFRRALHCI